MFFFLNVYGEDYTRGCALSIRKSRSRSSCFSRSPPPLEISRYQIHTYVHTYIHTFFSLCPSLSSFSLSLSLSLYLSLPLSASSTSSSSLWTSSGITRGASVCPCRQHPRRVTNACTPRRRLLHFYYLLSVRFSLKCTEFAFFLPVAFLPTATFTATGLHD